MNSTKHKIAFWKQTISIKQQTIDKQLNKNGNSITINKHSFIWLSINLALSIDMSCIIMCYYDDNLSFVEIEHRLYMNIVLNCCIP